MCSLEQMSAGAAHSEMGSKMVKTKRGKAGTRDAMFASSGDVVYKYRASNCLFASPVFWCIRKGRPRHRPGLLVMTTPR